jgi:hypothetical protein
MKKITLLILALVVVSTLLIAGCTMPQTLPAPTAKPTATPAATTAASTVGCAVYTKDPDSSERTLHENLLESQYCEIWVTCSAVGNLVYNTAGVNNVANPLDSCPKEQWSTFNSTQMIEQARVDGVYLNGPRGWTIDKVDLPTSTKVRDFQGIKATWWTSSTNQGKMPQYTRVDVQRDSQITFNAGTPLFIMDTPDNTTCVMKSWSMIVDKSLTYDDLFNLSSRIKPPAGFKYRVATYDQPLVMTPVNGIQSIVQDELENTYDCCDPGVCSIKP